MSPRATRYYTVAGDNYPTQALVLPSDTLRLPNTLGIPTCFASCYKQRAIKNAAFLEIFLLKKEKLANRPCVAVPPESAMKNKPRDIQAEPSFSSQLEIRLG